MEPIKGRGALSNEASRYAGWRREAEPAEPWEEPARHPATEIRPDAARTVISRNDSPDVPFTQSLNPYRGCEHGCVYCFARPSHARLDHSPGLDFETLIYAKHDAAQLLDCELRRPGYRVSPINLGANTDPYQPAERELGITRAVLAKCLEFGQPVTIVTKSALVTRDADLLGELARRRLAAVYVSVTTLDPALKRTLEPRAASPAARLRALAALSAAGVPTGVMVAPVIPALTDHELEAILGAARASGAERAAYVWLRVPAEVRALVHGWLAAHAPLRAERVRARLRDLHGGRENDPRFGHRMRGQGAYATAFRARLDLAVRRLGYRAREEVPALDCTQFAVPAAAAPHANSGPAQLSWL